MKGRSRSTSHTPIFSILVGFLVSGAALLVIALIFSFIAYGGSDPMAKVGIFSLLTLALGGFFAGIGVSRTRGEGGIGTSALFALISSAALIAIRLIFSSVGISALMSVGAYALSCILGAYFARPRQKRRRY